VAFVIFLSLLELFFVLLSALLLVTPPCGRCLPHSQEKAHPYVLVSGVVVLTDVLVVLMLVIAG
jgi:hypothetical protein